MQKKYPHDETVLHWLMNDLFAVDRKEHSAEIIESAERLLKSSNQEYRYGAISKLALTYSAIIKAVWGYQDSGSIKRLQVNMANIRKKLGIKPGDNRYIINELGVGYRMLTEG